MTASSRVSMNLDKGVMVYESLHRHIHVGRECRSIVTYNVKSAIRILEANDDVDAGLIIVSTDLQEVLLHTSAGSKQSILGDLERLTFVTHLPMSTNGNSEPFCWNVLSPIETVNRCLGDVHARCEGRRAPNNIVGDASILVDHRFCELEVEAMISKGDEIFGSLPKGYSALIHFDNVEQCENKLRLARREKIELEILRWLL